MNKSALLGLMLALVLPLSAYLLLQSLSDNAVEMPRHYLMDTVVTKEIKGKLVNDTVWHTTANIKLVNQLGDSVSLYDRPGKIIVADFFFTSCRGICPRLTSNMQTLQESFLRGGNTRKKLDSSIVQFISFTVDPEHDSVPVLKEYADRMGVNHDNWWMLTGDRKAIYDFAFNELKVDKFSEEPVTPDFVHTSRFVLLDKFYKVRGYYNGLDSASMLKLSRDIGLLLLEKDRTKKSRLFIQIQELGWLWLIIVVLVIFFVLIMQSRRKKENIVK
ncbi:MAG: SCO family protein [Bacteroidota bacterium]